MDLLQITSKKLLEITAGITNCGVFYKLSRNTTNDIQLICQSELYPSICPYNITRNPQEFKKSNKNVKNDSVDNNSCISRINLTVAGY